MSRIRLFGKTLGMLSLLGAFYGCKQTPPAPPPVLTDDALVHAHQKDGLGLGLRIQGQTFAHGASIPLHISMENFDSRIPLASGKCLGLTFDYQEITTLKQYEVDISAPDCLVENIVMDPIAFPRGQLRTMDLQEYRASQRPIPPGTYDATVTWTAFPLGGDPNRQGTKPYTRVDSNTIRFTVSP